MKRLMVMTLAACVLAFGMCSSALAMRFRLDPGPTPPGATVTNLYADNIGTIVPVAWQACTNQGIPTSFSNPTPTTPPTPPYIACLALNNLTGASITSLTFQFTVPTALAGQTVDCTSDGVYLASTTDCPTGKLVANQLVTFGFSGLPPIPDNTDFFLGASADGLTDPGQFPGVGVTATVPEPAELGMFGFGLLLIVGAVEVSRRRRA